MMSYQDMMRTRSMSSSVQGQSCRYIKGEGPGGGVLRLGLNHAIGPIDSNYYNFTHQLSSWLITPTTSNPLSPASLEATPNTSRVLPKYVSPTHL